MWYYGSEPVSVASFYKYLGLKFTTKVCLNRISEDCLESKTGNHRIFFKYCGMLVAWTSTCFSNSSMQRLYLSCSLDLNCRVVLIVQMLRKCICTPVKGY